MTLVRPLELLNNALTVHKFGGTSMSSINLVAEIIKTICINERPIVVVSAISGVTNKLYEWIEKSNLQSLHDLDEMHAFTVTKLTESGYLSKESGDALLLEIRADLNCIESGNVCRDENAQTNAHQNTDENMHSNANSNTHSITLSHTHSCVVGFGEIWASKILSAVLVNFGFKSKSVDAREFIFLANYEEVRVDWKTSRFKWKECMNVHVDVDGCNIPVITGFVASDHCGLPTTLKRNGSDFSGAIVANLSRATCLTIWTDVDGIYSADPRIVENAVCIKEMNYKESAELAYFGAKVIHPQTMAPCVQADIPIVLRNTFNLQKGGTLICATRTHERSECAVAGVDALQHGCDTRATGVLACKRSCAPCRAVTMIPQVAIVNVEGCGLFGFSGIAAKLFGAVAAAHVNIIMITQASSEYSICFAVPLVDGRACISALQSIFEPEIQNDELIISLEEASIVAAVGDGMHQQLGLMGTLATALGDARINIVAIAQGSSERNITFVVGKSDGIHALRALHQVLLHT